MNYKQSPHFTKDKNEKKLDKAIGYPTIADLIREQNVSSDHPNTVHYRRDLDSLG